MGGHIAQQLKGFQEDEEDIVFILFKGGKFRDLRLEYPLLVPIYELVKKEMECGGSFHQFLADSVETLFAIWGYELALSPKRQREVYDEVARLKREGELGVIIGEGGLKLDRIAFELRCVTIHWNVQPSPVDSRIVVRYNAP